MPSPGLPPTSFMPSTSLASGPMPPSSQPGAPVPMYPGGLHNQVPAPPMASGPFSPTLGSGYPQGGPGAPAVKPFTATAVAPPPTGTHHVGYFLVNSCIHSFAFSHTYLRQWLQCRCCRNLFTSAQLSLLIWLAGYFPWLNSQCDHQGDRVRVGYGLEVHQNIHRTWKIETPVQCHAKVSMFLVAQCMFGVCLCYCMLKGDIVT